MHGPFLIYQHALVDPRESVETYFPVQVSTLSRIVRSRRRTRLMPGIRRTAVGDLQLSFSTRVGRFGVRFHLMRRRTFHCLRLGYSSLVGLVLRELATSQFPVAVSWAVNFCAIFDVRISPCSQRLTTLSLDDVLTGSKVIFVTAEARSTIAFLNRCRSEPLKLKVDAVRL